MEQITAKDVPSLEWWTPREVANSLRLSEDTIIRRITAGTIRAANVGTPKRARYRVHVGEVRRLQSAGLPAAERKRRETFTPVAVDELATCRARGR